MKYDNRFNKELIEAYDNTSLFNRFYINPIEEQIVDWPQNLAEKRGYKLDYSDMFERLKYLLIELAEKDIGKQLVKIWYNYKPGVGFNLDTIFSRAEYNAKPEDFDIANKTKRGKALIKDYGFSLVSESYVFFIDLRDVEKKVTYDYDDIRVEFESNIGIYVFKLGFDEDKINKFYNSWVYDSDNDSVIKEKLNNFEKMYFPFELVYFKKDILVQGSRSEAEKNIKDRSEALQYLSQQAFDRMIQDIYTQVNVFVPKKVEELRIKSHVNHKHPISANIGRKEGLQVDDKFGVYEYIWDNKHNRAKPKLRTTVRVRKVGDNITDKNTESSYYQITLGKVKQGMVLREIPYHGISIMADYYPSGGYGFSILNRSKDGRAAVYGSASLSINAVPKYDIEGVISDSSAFKLGFGMARGGSLVFLK